MTELKKKGILLAVSIVLLVSATLYLAFAWYTKMTSVSNIEFTAAKWDFRANYSSDSYEINVYNYPRTDASGLIVEEGKAAPGTAGFVPVLLSATSSETDVNYSITVDKSTMSKEFQERIYFYSDPLMRDTDILDSEHPLTGTIPHGQAVTAKVYWKWIYEKRDVPAWASSILPGETAEQFDAFDLKVGKNPEQYTPYMGAQLYITGAQTQPGAPASP